MPPSTPATETGLGRFRGIAAPKPKSPFRFGAGMDGLDTGAVATGVQPQAANGPVAGNDMLEMLRLILGQATEQHGQDLGFREKVAFGRHLGTGGGEITPANPTGNLSNPWAADGLFRGGFGGKAEVNSPGPGAHSWSMPWATPKGPMNGGAMPQPGNGTHLADPAAIDALTKSRIGTRMDDGWKYAQGKRMPGSFINPFAPKGLQPWKPGANDFAENQTQQFDLPGKRNKTKTGAQFAFTGPAAPKDVYPVRRF